MCRLAVLAWRPKSSEGPPLRGGLPLLPRRGVGEAWAAMTAGTNREVTNEHEAMFSPAADGCPVLASPPERSATLIAATNTLPRGSRPRPNQAGPPCVLKAG